jgi:hypothetical protein
VIVDIDRAYEPGAVLAMASRIGHVTHFTSGPDPLVDARKLQADVVIVVSPEHYHHVAWQREAKQRGITYVRCG